MPNITKTFVRFPVGTADGVWARLTPQVLTADDVLVGYERGARQVLWLRNPTGGTLNIMIKGDGLPATYFIDGHGPRTFPDFGFTVTLTAGQTKVLPLDTVFLYLDGATTINVTGGAGAQVAFIEAFSSGVTTHNG